MKERRVDVWVEHEEGLKWTCPGCDRGLPLYDHVEERCFRYPDSCQVLTSLHARPTRVEGSEPGVPGRSSDHDRQTSRHRPRNRKRPRIHDVPLEVDDPPEERRVRGDGEGDGG